MNCVLVSFLRVLILYPIVIFGVRLMGKRQIAELQPSELVITILISNITTLPLEDPSIPLAIGIMPVLTLVCLEVLLSQAALKWRGLRRLISGRPQVIVRNGEIDQQVMRSLRFSLDDLMTALRSNGIFDLREVQLAIVETNGTVSVYQQPDARPVTCGDLQITPPQSQPPEILIADGKISSEGLQAAGMTKEKLQSLLKQRRLVREDVFLLSVDRQGICSLVLRQKGGIQ